MSEHALAVSMNLFALSNVELHPDVSKKLGQETIGQPPIDMCRLVMNLAMANPLWRFVVTDTQGEHRPVGFSVIDSGEVIGKIGRQYYRGDHKLSLTNDRISDARERTSSYRTGDVDKAILMAKKMFFRLKPNERIEKAYGTAKQVMQNQWHDKQREHRYAEREIESSAVKFIMGTGFPLFLSYLDGLPEHEKKPMLKKMEQTGKHKQDMLTIESIKEKFGSEHTALIIKDEGKYMVKIGQDVQIYDDNTLPEHMRGKLGMLKLVEAEHFISNIGCRINDEIFVVLTEET
jgi:hypothetical protein